MLYLACLLPLIAIVLCMVSGRVSSVTAGACGLTVAAVIAVTAAPTTLTGMGLLTAIARGLWLSWLVAAVIFAGLAFREIISNHPGRAVEDRLLPPRERRRRVFFACFLIGPFAEAATGFGVGQVTTVAMLQALGLPAIHITVLSLFSQVLVSWGAMANGTIVGAALANLPPWDLGTHSAILNAPLLLVWLAMFWRMTAAAGLVNGFGYALSEVATLAIAVMLLVIANAKLGPEVAGMVALGPLIVIHFWLGERPDATRWRSVMGVGMPYVALILGLAASRGIPALSEWLRAAGAVHPFVGLPPWIPLLHPGTWLLGIGLSAGALQGRSRDLPRLLHASWRRGRAPVATITVYLTVAQVMSESGMAAALAAALAAGLGPFAVIATPWLAGAFGFLTGSSNAANGLLMASQVGLSGSVGIPAIWIAALQNTAAASLTMLSPSRVAMGCALVQRTDLETAVYRKAWPLGAVALVTLTILFTAWTLLR